MTGIQLPAGVQVIERGWLSSNSVVFTGSNSSAIVDSGYGTRAEQTVALVASALRERPLDTLINTHLHSDHCGGNAALQGRFPALETLIPPGMAPFVANWDPVALGYAPTGQSCSRFKVNGLVLPGSEIELADMPWQVHAAPGHDPDSVILFEPWSRTLISADALWENGFGVVFPELEGESAFDQVAATFDLIEQLDPGWVIPGHGPMFQYSPQILARARARLAAFVKSPARHARHGAKVLLKFKLLDSRQMAFAELVEWAVRTPYLQRIHGDIAASVPISDWIENLSQELVHSNAVRRVGATIHDN